MTIAAAAAAQIYFFQSDTESVSLLILLLLFFFLRFHHFKSEWERCDLAGMFLKGMCIDLTAEDFGYESVASMTVISRPVCR